MPCLVRSEMDGRCSTCELLFSHTVSSGLHSHPSSLPWCLPLPAGSSGPANPSHGHWFLLPTTQKKNTSSSFFVVHEESEGWEERKKKALGKSCCYCHFLLPNPAPLSSIHRGVSSQQGMLSTCFTRLTVLLDFLNNSLMPTSLIMLD